MVIPHKLHMNTEVVCTVPWYCRLSTAGSRVSLGCVCNTIATLSSAVAVLTPRKTSSITWILAAPAGYWLKMVHSWNVPSALSSMEPVDMPAMSKEEY